MGESPEAANAPADARVSVPAVRNASGRDVGAIQLLINTFADRKLMLLRSLSELYETLRDFHVAEVAGDIVGCVALHPVWEDLAEVKSLAVAESHHGMGIGSELLRAALEDARALGIPKVFALTYRADFFERAGFARVDKGTLPHKIWFECSRCPLFPDCKEEAVMIELEVATADGESV